MTPILSKLTLLLLLTFGSLAAKAQDNANTQRDEKIRVLLGMDNGEYKTYIKTVKDYDKRLHDVVKDSSLTKAAKGAAMSSILSQKRDYQQTTLSEEQRKKLSEFNRRMTAVSPYKNHQKDVEERLRKKGITVTVRSGN